MMNIICVYLGVNSGNNPNFHQATIQLAHAIVKNDITLVYGAQVWE